MILLLLFSISSTIRASNAQTPNYKYYVVRMRKNRWGAYIIRIQLKIIEKKNFVDFLVGSKYGK